MTNKQLTPKLYLRKDKTDNEGRMPLFMRFRRIEGKEPKFSMGKIRLSFDEWDESTKLPKDAFLRIKVERELTRIQQELLRCTVDDITITIDKLKEIVKNNGKANPQENLFSKYHKEYIAKREREGRMRQSTLQSHIFLLNALEEFNKDLKVKDINAVVINKFITYLRDRKIARGKDVTNLTFENRLIQIRSVIRYIANKNIPINDPFKSGEIFIKPCGRSENYLSEKELAQMIALFYTKDISIAENRILMMFLLSCATGMRISDVRALRWKNVNLDCKNGVIEYCCQKTLRMNYMPLSPMSEDILCYAPEGDIENVEHERHVFVKVYSPTKINSTLKLLAKKAGITKNISFHSARRTFATLCYANDTPYEFIKQLLGHKPIDVTLRYCQWNVEEADKAAPKLSFLDMKKLRKLA